jgi:hypothetical protein
MTINLGDDSTDLVHQRFVRQLDLRSAAACGRAAAHTVPQPPVVAPARDTANWISIAARAVVLDRVSYIVQRRYKLLHYGWVGRLPSHHIGPSREPAVHTVANSQQFILVYQARRPIGRGARYCSSAVRGLVHAVEQPSPEGPDGRVLARPFHHLTHSASQPCCDAARQRSAFSPCHLCQ